MKEFEEKPDSIDQEIIIPVKTERKRIVSRPLRPSTSLWEVDLKTHECSLAKFKSSEVVVDGNKMNQTRLSIDYRTDKFYCQALNMANAIRKYRRWFVANQKARIMLSRQPKPESPSAAASQ